MSWSSLCSAPQIYKNLYVDKMCQRVQTHVKDNGEQVANSSGAYHQPPISNAGMLQTLRAEPREAKLQMVF